ncbi:MAG: serine/threonine protein kinase [Candidatus Riflebacteria bacterium]|nr:serine/threonine protein kinase [Candidatus Riflebacteria bacterium]
MSFPPSLAQRYEPIELLGKGGMGIVYQARKKDTGLLVAVKVLISDFSQDQEMRDRFEAEARLAGRVHHTNVVGIVESGETDEGRLYMITELVEGKSLRQILDKLKKLPVPKVIGLGRALLSGVGAIHQQGIIHRDLKPTNLLINRQGTLKIIDFGIAKEIANSSMRSASGELLGTPWYLSPEQIRGDKTSPATDVYAAGAILYEAIAGQQPYPGDNLFAILEAHLSTKLTPLGDLAPECPEELAGVIQKMLAKAASDRYQSCDEVLAAIRALGSERSGLYVREPPRGTAPTAAEVTQPLQPPTQLPSPDPSGEKQPQPRQRSIARAQRTSGPPSGISQPPSPGGRNLWVFVGFLAMALAATLTMALILKALNRSGDPGSGDPADPVHAPRATPTGSVAAPR